MNETKILDVQFKKGIPKSLTLEFEGKEYRFFTEDKLKSARALIEKIDMMDFYPDGPWLIEEWLEENPEEKG